MAEKYPWLRMKGPTRTRTPPTTLDADIPPVSDSNSNVETPLSPKRRARPRLSSRLSHILTSKTDPDTEPWADWDVSSPVDNRPPGNHKIVLESLMAHLFDQFGEPRPLCRNQLRQLFIILEDYRRLLDDNEELVHRVKAIEEQHKVKLEEHKQRQQESEQAWALEEEKFRAEIKRLEVLIAQGTRGMSGLMQARRGSVVDRKRTRRLPSQLDDTPPQEEEKQSSRSVKPALRVRTNQDKHDPFRIAAISPSTWDAETSANLLATDRYDIKPASVGAPPRHTLRPLTQTTRDFGTPATGPATDVRPDDARSLFSTDGDMFPEELQEENTEIAPSRQSTEDLRELKGFASVIARKRGISLQSILPAVLDLFSGKTANENKAPLSFDPVEPSKLNVHTRGDSNESATTQRSRPFSFEAGDDNTANAETRQLRKTRSEHWDKPLPATPGSRRMSASHLRSSNADSSSSPSAREVDVVGKSEVDAQSRYTLPVSWTTPLLTGSRDVGADYEKEADLMEQSGNGGPKGQGKRDEGRAKTVHKAHSTEWNRRDTVIRRKS